MKLSITRSIAAAGLVFGLSAITLAPVHAQVTPTTRAQVKMDRDAFFAMARWDSVTENWVLKDEFVMPAGVMSRAEVKSMRDKFLSMNTWDDGKSQWIPVGGTPRDMSKMTREQVKAETERFLKVYRFDEQSSSFVKK